MSKSIESLYLTKSRIRSRLLGLLFSNPEKSYYLSELARMVKTSAGNVQRELARFVADELMRRENRGPLVFYTLNPNHALFPELQSLISKTLGIEAELRNLVAEDKHIELAIIYGSVASRRARGESDIDLLIVSNGALRDFYKDLARLESRLNREINPTAYSREEFRSKLAQKDSFLTHVLKHPVRILKGSLHVYQEKHSGRSSKKH